ncbi:hypothetical protein [Polymorphospora sp. NPDC050346]|uniref:hypothetical protein n=1 Tax=Polymorphospora sp. NPDC050346 TaxID=3155780 RepID=UPI0033C7A372
MTSLDLEYPLPQVAPAASGGAARPTVAGCHGGAGTTTVASLLAPASDAGTLWPTATSGPLVLVTRGTLYGARRATLALAHMREAGVVPAVLVVVAEGPLPQPQGVALRLRLLSSRVPAIVRLPYVTRWRYLDDPLSQRLPRRLRQPLQQILTAADAP